MPLDVIQEEKTKSQSIPYMYLVKNYSYKIGFLKIQGPSNQLNKFGFHN